MLACHIHVSRFLVHVNNTFKFNCRCFSSKNGQVAIYVEATQGQSVNKRTSEIEYDLQPLPKGVNGYDLTEGNRKLLLMRAFHATEIVADLPNVFSYYRMQTLHFVRVGSRFLYQ